MSTTYVQVLVVGSRLATEPATPDTSALGQTLAEAATKVAEGSFPDWNALAARADLLVGTTTSARAELLARASVESQDVRLAEGEPTFESATIYDNFFRVERVASWGPDDRRATVAPAVRALVADLPHAELPIDDKAVLLRFASTLIAGGSLTVPPVAPATGGPPGRVLSEAGLDVHERWRLGHHFFALANRALADRIVAMEDAIPFCTWSDVEAPLDEARCLLPAVTASMEYASALASRQYLDLVRGTMDSNALPVELAGSMNRDYLAYRQAITRLVTRALDGHNVTSLAAVGTSIARGVEELLSLDLLDFERHIALAHRLVGVLPALDEKSGSAVHSLRGEYLTRLVRYLPFFSQGQLLGECFPPCPSCGEAIDR